MRLFTISLLILSVLGLAGLCAAQERQGPNLDGQWEFVKVKDLAAGPPAEGWNPIAVPGLLNGINYERAWFRRGFTVPDTMRGSLVLHFGGVKWNSVVLVNGKEVGRHLGGYEPFDIDITAAIKRGMPNRLEVGCCDWTGTFIDRETDLSPGRAGGQETREIPQDKIISPIGGTTNLYGIWDGVSLSSHPAVYVKDLFIKPSVRQHTLTVEYTLANETDQAAPVEIEPTVLAGGKAELSLPTTPATVPAHGETSVTVAQAWPNPRLWSPEDPHLYMLATTLRQAGKDVDQHQQRFGFRELWTEGPNFILNGQRISLLATSWWPEYGKTEDYIRERMRAIKAANCVIFRTHTQPWPELWYEVADEVGLMMVPEGAVWNDDAAYRVNDPQFWANYAGQLHAEVLRDRNKPSVVMYSLENEFYGGRVSQGSHSEEELAKLGRLMKQWDPTRPIVYESDGDPQGVADVVGIHYPHEYPEYVDWPNTAYWLDTPMNASYFFVKDPTTKKNWVWDRQKPLYIGEFLWIPSSDPSWHTVFYGDDAYLDYELYRAKAKGDSWRIAIQAYRQYGVGGISPWTMVEGGPLDEAHNPMYAAQKYAMAHQAAYLREYDHDFYGGATVTRSADLYNDVLAPAKLTLSWELLDGARTTANGEQTLAMQAGERRALTFSVTLPPVKQRQEMAMRLRVAAGGKQVFEDTKQWSVFPKLSLRAGGAVGLFDPAGTTREKLNALGVTTSPVADLAAIPPQTKLLIIGARAFQPAAAGVPVIGQSAGPGAQLMGFVKSGGRVLVLEQEQYPGGLLPVSLSQQKSTMTFPQMPAHPLLRDVRPADLKWWAPDNYVSLAEPPRPADQGGFQAIVVSGSANGLAYAPLSEFRYGRGTLVLCQLRVGERLGVEPVAGVILQNALDYLDAYKPALARTALYCPEARTRGVLSDLGLQATDITANPAGAEWANTDLLIACAPLTGLEGCLPQLRALLARGGAVLLHGLKPDDFAQWQPLLGIKMKLAPYGGPVCKAAGTTGLAAFFANEDLYWLQKQATGWSWDTRPLADGVASAALSQSLEGKPVTEYPHEKMTVTGSFAADGADYASQPSGGSTATVQVQVPRDGDYLLGVVAGGTEAKGGWPAGTVFVDDRAFGVFSCQRGEFDTYSVAGKLTAGAHQVAIRFTNDLYDEVNKQDRNLWVKSLLVAPADAEQALQPLSTPAAVAAVAVGPGRVVIDEINWDTTATNTDKARRYIAGLLAGLNAPFAAGGIGTVIDLSRFEPDPQMVHWRRDGSGVMMASGGYMVGKVQCAKAGRYQMRIIARGTPCRGILPIVAVELDGKSAGQVQLTSEDWRGYPLAVEMPQGEHELKLIFANDENVGGEDRNVWIARVEVREGE